MGTREHRIRRRAGGRRTLRRGPGERTLLDPKVLFPGDMGLSGSWGAVGDGVGPGPGEGRSGRGGGLG